MSFQPVRRVRSRPGPLFTAGRRPPKRARTGEYKRPADEMTATAMPIRRRSRAFLRMRRRTKRRGGRAYLPRRAPLNIPPTMTRRLSTVMRASINPASSSAPTVQVFNLNGLYDPTGAISSQQPLYFDQYSGLY